MLEDIRAFQAASVAEDEPTTCELLDFLMCDRMPQILMGETSCPETSGLILLASTDFREVDLLHLSQDFIRLPIPGGSETAIAERILWMVHAGTRSPNTTWRATSEEIADLCLQQLVGEMVETEDAETIDVGRVFDLETFSAKLLLCQQRYPETVAALLRGDLYDVFELPGDETLKSYDDLILLDVVRTMSLIWKTFYLQLETCLAWRLARPEHRGPITRYVPVAYKGKSLLPAQKQYEYGVTLWEKYEQNLEAGRASIDDKREINGIKRKLLEFGYQPAVFFGDDRGLRIKAHSAFRSATHLKLTLAHAQLQAAKALNVSKDGKVITGSVSGAKAHGRKRSVQDGFGALTASYTRLGIQTAYLINLSKRAYEATTMEELAEIVRADRPETLLAEFQTFTKLEWERWRQLLLVMRSEHLQDKDMPLNKARYGPEGNWYQFELDTRKGAFARDIKAKVLKTLKEAEKSKCHYGLLNTNVQGPGNTSRTAKSYSYIHPKMDWQMVLSHREKVARRVVESLSPPIWQGRLHVTLRRHRSSQPRHRAGKTGYLHDTFLGWRHERRSRFGLEHLPGLLGKRSRQKRRR